MQRDDVRDEKPESISKPMMTPANIEQFLRETEACLRNQALTPDERDAAIELYEDLLRQWEQQQQPCPWFD